ncbi:YhgE/Pip family protein [Trueperella pecoris]|uniref:YhgE/Pip domain-containing protein n=1 Tax=Trueperella pecoris TaxID=2733571 RepID=A0A7M1QV50_9ACTO|nr:YhgE/Pip domain-containing protein [Trueperella pecoris]QOQ38129.1 YhgE/Pip domain-containing protein [Trueperella pecoris]QOR45384.1 YhgE/Pip domain-containing protein [Trueperella pecoris]
MIHPLKSAALEFKHYRGIPVIALIFILIVPALYGGVYLHANWDLYHQIDKVKVAIVNGDKPVDFDGQTIDAGARFVEAIKGQDGFDWQFPESEPAAARQLSNGEVYMVVTVPPNFSANLVSAGHFQPERATITFHRDDANGFIAGSLLSQMQSIIQEQVNSAVGQAYFSTLFGQLSVIRDGMNDAATGARQLSDGLSQAADGVGKLNAALTDVDVAGLEEDVKGLSEAMSTLDRGATSVLLGVSGATGSISGLSGMTEGLEAGKDSVKAALGPLRSYVNDTLPKLKDNALNLAKLTGSLSGDANHVIGRSKGALDAVRSALAQIVANPALANDPAFLAKLQEDIAASSSLLGDLSSSVSGQMSLTSDLQAHLDYGAMKSAVEAADAALGALDSSFANVGQALRNVGSAADEIRGGVDQVNAGKTKLTELVNAVSGKIPKAVAGASQLVDAIAKLDIAMQQLNTGAGKLADGLEQGVAKIPALTDAQVDRLAEIMSSPVTINTVVDNDAETYGRGLAPFFFSIALWVSSVTFFLVMRTLSGRAALSRGSVLATAVHGFAPFAVIGVTSSLLMGLGVWGFLGLHPAHPWLFVLLLVVAALSFMSLAYWVRLGLGSPQSAVFLVALILQLPASGGTFPTDMLNPFYRALSVISPMRYSVDAFRVAISGGTDQQYWGSLAVLAGILIFSLGMTYWLVGRRRILRMRDLHPPMITGESTGDYAFSIRPR